MIESLNNDLRYINLNNQYIRKVYYDEIVNIILKKENRMNLIKFKCDITNELDKLAHLDTKKNSLYRHYILLENNNILPIRIPGGTVGDLYIRDNKVEKIIIDTNYVVKTYNNNVNELINSKFIGTDFNINELINKCRREI